MNHHQRRFQTRTLVALIAAALVVLFFAGPVLFRTVFGSPELHHQVGKQVTITYESDPQSRTNQARGELVSVSDKWLVIYSENFQSARLQNGQMSRSKTSAATTWVPTDRVIRIVRDH